MFDQSAASLAALAPVASRIELIHNPTSGSRNRGRMRRFAVALAGIGLRVAVRQTRCAGDAEVLAASLHAGGDGLLCIAGGDGTINEAINGLAAPMPTVALLPLGTANVLAAELGLPSDPARLAAVVARGVTRSVHLPLANGRRFTMMVGVGFDAHVVAAVDGRRKRALGKLAYVEAFARTLWRHRERRYVVEIDGVRHEAGSVVVANGHFYGGRFTCAPDARLDEPELHVCLFRSAGRRAVLGCGLSLVLGRLHRRRDVTIVRGREVSVFGRPGEPVQCDGDVVTTLPLAIRATGETLRFITASAA